MAELKFSHYLLYAFILFLQIELFFSFCFNNFLLFTKNLRVMKQHDLSNFYNITYNNYYYYFSLVLFLYTSKGFISKQYIYLLISSFILISFFYFLKVFSKNNKVNNVITVSIGFLLLGYMLMLLQVQSFLTLFFYIELYGVLYYFTFISHYTFSNTSLMQYKNGILLLLWNNFFTTFFFFLSLFLFLRYFGTTNIIELANLLTTSPIVIFYFIGLSWKLGLPLFHFFKLEVYNFLIKENIFFFSIVTTLVNLYILFFFFSIDIVLSSLIEHFLVIIFLLVGICLVILSLKLSSILYYLALSSVLTATTVVALLLVSNVC